jgi:hypothetical protein
MAMKLKRAIVYRISMVLGQGAITIDELKTKTQ